MIRVGHLHDDSAGWEQRVGVSQLLDHLPGDRYVSVMAATDPGAVTALRPLSRRIELLPRLTRFSTLNAPGMARFLVRQKIDLVHAWGGRAAAAVRATPDTPLVVQLFDPLLARRDAKLLRAMARPQRFAVACSSEIVRRRLIEGGLAPDLSVVIRPGVDFALINGCQHGQIRESLGLSREDFVVVVPEPATREGGQFEAFQAAAHRRFLAPDLRVIVPGVSREQRRIVRFAATLPQATALVTPGTQYPFEQLVAVSNALLITPRGDVSTTSIAWAMASGAVVIGTAVHAVAEMIADKLNGLLFKQVSGMGMCAPISKLLQDRTSQQKARETARGQAFEAFGLRRYVEQNMRLYENVLSGRSPGEGIG